MSAEFGQALLDRATAAANNAYCNYSDFPVGASVATPDGKIIDGCNIENASYGLAICGERTAIFKAVSEGHRKLAAIAVDCLKGDVNDPDSLMPCGACLQVMREFMDPSATVLVRGVGKFALQDLLPRAFHL
jgi:cytidine deaminase